MLISLLTLNPPSCEGESAAFGRDGGGLGIAGAMGPGGDGGTGDTGSGGGGTGGGISGLGGTANSGRGGAGGSATGSAGRGGAGGTGVAAPGTLKFGAERTGRLIGAALSASHLSEAGYAMTAAAELNFATPENEMKWDATEPMPNVFTFARGDAIVAFAAQNGMKVKGHTLVWHSQLPSWVSSIQDPTDLRDALVNHIYQVVSHYRGQVTAWDVINEAVTDGSASLRSTVFYQLLGPSYLDDAFIVAHAADPAARLHYNDYGAEGLNAKANFIYTMVQGMLARGVPIHGVGLQMHTGWVDAPSAAEIASNMQRLAALGLEVVISEMDVQICNSDLDTQGRRFHDIVAVCVAQPACKAVTVWGVPDKYSWRNGQSCAMPRPLLFDDNYLPKPAHAGVLNAFLGL